MGARIVRTSLVGTVLWAGLAVACSAAGMDPPAGPLWEGSVEAREGARLKGRPLSIAWDTAEDSETLYRVEPRTLELRDPLPLGVQALREWGLSPDGTHLLLGTGKGHVRVVDVERMRDVARYRLGASRVTDVAWVGDDVAILVTAWRDTTKLLRFRPSTGDVLDSARVDAYAFETAHAANGIALLGYDAHDYEDVWEKPGPVTFAVMDATGELGVRRVPEVGAGYYGPPGDSVRVDPALAVGDGAAAIVGTDGTVVSVDLGDLSITGHEPEESLLGSLAAWLVPEAHAKTLEWTTVDAEYVTSDLLLVSGRRVHVMSRDEGTTPGGAALVDLDDGGVRVFDHGATDAQAAGDVLLAWRRFMGGDERGAGIGLVAYDHTGERVWHVMRRGFVDVLAVHDGVAYLQHGWDRIFLTSVDLATGEVLKRRATNANVLAL